MRIGQVVGTVVGARKDARLDGRKLLIVAAVDRNGAQDTPEVVAVDTVGAGEGETVIVAEGTAARRAIGGDDVPIDAAVIAIVDETYRADA